MFKNATEFSLHIEGIRESLGLDSYIEALLYFYEHESDHEMSDIVKMLNKKIVSEIEVEARNLGMLKDNTPLVTLS